MSTTQATTQLPCSPPSSLRDRLKKLSYKPWDPIRKQGRKANYFYFSGVGLIGEFRVLKNSKQILMSKQGNGHLFGREELENNEACSSSLISLSESIVYQGNREDLKYCRNQSTNPDEWNQKTNQLRKDYHEKIDQVISLGLEERLALEILELAQLIGRKVPDGIEISIPISRINLSQILGCALESVSRIISEWTTSGLVRTEKKIITVTKPNILMSKSPEGFSVFHKQNGNHHKP